MKPPRGKKRPLRVRQPMRPCAAANRKTMAERYEEEEELMIVDNSEADSVEIDGISIFPAEKIEAKKSKAIFVIENAALEVAKVGKDYVLLNSSDHSEFLLKRGKELHKYRPDILHQELLMVLDSPLNKSGNLQAVYVTTMSSVLIEVNPRTRIPRTYNRFAGLMLQLLQKLSVSAVGKNQKLMRLIKNPVTQYLPVNSRKIGLSSSSEKRVKLKDYVTEFNNDTDLVFVVGAMAGGKIEVKYIDGLVAVSGYPLSGAYCVTMICQALEAKWNIF